MEREAIQKLWKEVLASVGKDRIETFVYLFFDNLASILGRKLEAYFDPGIMCSEVLHETGKWDHDLEAKAWRKAKREYAIKYRNQLGLLSSDDIEIALDLIDMLK